MRTLEGEGDKLLEIMADGCTTPARWASLLETPLERACLDGHTRLVKKLVLAGATVGYASFYNAAAMQRWDTLLELIILTERKDFVKELGGCVLSKAAQSGQLCVVKKLLDAGVDLSRLREAIILAIRDAGAHARSILRLLLDQPGATKAIAEDPRIPGISDNDTPLLISARKGMRLICSMLLKKGADPNARRSASNPTPLFNAVFVSQDTGTVRVLLQGGADPNLKCGVDGRTAVHLVCQGGDNSAAILGTLIDHGVNVGAPDDRGVTPLHIASGVALSTSDTIIRLLIDAGADVNARKRNGNTPLHSAARHVRVHAVGALLWRGADESLVTNGSHLKPLDVVGRRVIVTTENYDDDCEQVRELLTRAPADRAWRRRSCVVLCRARRTGRVVRRSKRLLRDRNPDEFGDLVCAVTDVVFRKIVGYL